MSIISEYSFYNMSRIGNDSTDFSQRNVQNTQYSNYILSNHFSNNNSFVNFATQHPNVNYSGVNGGSSVGSSNIDTDSYLLLNKDSLQSSDIIQLNQRPYLTIPYLGRGSCDPVLESQLLQGDVVSGKKSVSTISETSYIDYNSYPMMDSLRDTVTNPKYSVEESAMNGWTRGGSSSRI
jgi:hypothetical protein